jgi:peroxiredoxin
MCKRRRIKIGNRLWSLLIYSIWIFFASPTQSAEAPSSSSLKTWQVPSFELTKPEIKGEKEYLGLSGQGKFTLSNVQTRILIIESFSMYCPHCQKEAPNVNALFAAIEADAGLRNKVKLIGIGAGNTPFEVDFFKKKYKVPFPLFSDEDLHLTRLLGVTATPTFIGVEIRGDGSVRGFYAESGSLGDVHTFLKRMMALSQAV